MKKKPFVSVNIRTFNSAKTLRETLDSVKEQTFQDLEIIVSDGFSSDESIAIAREYGAKVDFAQKLGDAREQNSTNSKGKYILSLDSDQVLDKKLIESCVKECEAGEVNAIIIAEKSIVKGGTFLEKIIAYDKWLIDRTRSVDPIFGTACPRFFERKLLQGIQWPKGISVFDDTILYSELLKKGAKIGYLSNEFIRHKEVTSWWIFMKKFYRYGKGYFSAFKENPTTITVHSLPRRTYFSKYAFSKPHYFLGLIILYIVKAFSASMGAAAYFIASNSKKE